MSVAQSEPNDPIDQELEQLLREPDVRRRLDEFERRRREGHLGDGVSHNDARRAVGLPPLADDDPRL